VETEDSNRQDANKASKGMVEMEGKRFLVEATVEDGEVVINIPSGTKLRNPIHMVRFTSENS